MKWLQKQGPPILIHILALLPLALLARDLMLGQLTADPIRETQLRTGRYALILLVISLACTPVYNVLNVKWLLLLRRLAGLYAFAYASLHLLNFVWVDYGFNIAFLQDAVLEKPFAIAGMAAFLCLVPVAITSSRGWQQRLGNRWKHLHRLVYLGALLAVVHFFWQVKIDTRVPLIFSALIVVLLIVRLPIISKIMGRAGRRMRQ